MTDLKQGQRACLPARSSRRLRLDRVLHSSVHYPTDYGFIVDTLARDGDHLDVLVLVEEPSLPGTMQRALRVAWGQTAGAR